MKEDRRNRHSACLPRRDARRRQGGKLARIAAYTLCGLLPLAAALLLPAGIHWRPEVMVSGLVLLRYLYLAFAIVGAERIIRLRRRIARSPAEPTNYFRLAVALYRSGFAGEAVSVFRQGMRLDPGMLVETSEGAVRILCRFGGTERERRIIRALCGLALMEHVVEEAGDFPKPLADIMALGAAGDTVKHEVQELLDNLKRQRDGVELLVQSLPSENHQDYLALDAELKHLDTRIRELEEMAHRLAR